LDPLLPLRKETTSSASRDGPVLNFRHQMEVKLVGGKRRNTLTIVFIT